MTLRSRSPRNEKPLHWVGSSKRDLLEFPDKVAAKRDYEARYGKEAD